MRVLLIEDNEDDVLIIRTELEDRADQDIELEDCDCLADGLERLDKNHIDAVLLDLGLPDSSGLDTLEQTLAKRDDLPIVVLTGHDDESLGRSAVQRGAQDYLVKGKVDGDSLGRSIRYSIERVRRLRAERNVMRQEADLRVARQIQFDLLPHEAPRIEGFDIAGRTVPAESVGGDYYDFIPLNDGNTGIVVGDVTGHGIGPAIIMATKRACLHTLARQTNCPGSLFTEANSVLTGSMANNRFITALLVKVDVGQKTLNYVNAGHPHGVLFGAAGQVRTLLDDSDFPIGIDEETQYRSSDPVSMAPGDVLLLFTDGVNEAMNSNHEQFGFDRAYQVVRDCHDEPAERIIAQLFERILQHMDNEPAMDDITAVVVKVC